MEIRSGYAQPSLPPNLRRKKKAAPWRLCRRKLVPLPVRRAHRAHVERGGQPLPPASQNFLFRHKQISFLVIQIFYFLIEKALLLAQRFSKVRRKVLLLPLFFSKVRRKVLLLPLFFSKVRRKVLLLPLFFQKYVEKHFYCHFSKLLAVAKHFYCSPHRRRASAVASLTMFHIPKAL